jgi:diacylglycerol O-acyltransferase / wax synthase
MAGPKTLNKTHLKAHDPHQHASLAIAAVAIVDGALPDYGLLKTLLAERIQSLPRCTQLLRSHPSDTAQDWIDYPGFDLAQHVHRVTIPPPGDDAELFRAVAYALERPLDLDRPLWECWVIEGLQDNQWAILMKIHHCLADGISAAHILTRLCDEAETDTSFSGHDDTNRVGAKPVRTGKPGWSEALSRFTSQVSGVAGTLASAMWPATTPSVERVPTMRRYSTVRVPIDAVDGVCRKFGVSTNDVALAAITEGFRKVLLNRGEQPRADSLRTMDRPDERSSAMLPYLPVEHDDPVQRLRTVHNRLKANRTDKRQSSILESAISCLPIVLRSKAIQLLTRLPQRGIVSVATSVPGPRHQLRLLGQRLERMLPIPPTALALSTGVAVLSYGDELVFGITAGYDAAPEIRQLAAGIELGMARLVALSQDSVLLFGKDHRRKRSSRGLPNQAQRGRPSAPERARY